MTDPQKRELAKCTSVWATPREMRASPMILKSLHHFGHIERKRVPSRFDAWEYVYRVKEIAPPASK